MQMMDGKIWAAREQEPMDIASALGRLEGDADLLQDAATLFLEGLPDLLADIRAAVNAGDSKAIERSAHRLRGSVGNFSALPTFEAAWRLESLGRDGILSETERAHSELVKEIDRLKSAMADLVALERLPSGH